ncbi:TerB N-terminal domain-containing protein [Deinococcus budaensis]|uniref:TerB-C domain-containing protein n=1 Tax=Deinococcus budaensis TaxID=1665626 RepID=A0A7W8GH53_9DEIO|nr:hypothetical protein [Deinococcus budaensis]
MPRRPAPPHGRRWLALQKRRATRGSFLFDARQWVSTAHSAVPHAPLKAYWTTYADLNTEQRQWYFYWRTRFRSGEALPTDLSYVFLHTYEILHGVGFENPAVAFAQLERLWQSYRTQHPSLDRYLVDWLSDFVHYYELTGADSAGWLARAPRFRTFASGDEIIEAWLASEDRAALTEGVFQALITYRPSENKFYRDSADQADLQATLQRAVLLTDAYHHQVHGESVFTALAPQQVREHSRQAFSGAVFEGEAVERETTRVRAFRDDGRLIAHLTVAVRYAENLARRRAGFRSLLRGVDIEPELAAYLDEHLYPRVRPSIQIDAERLTALQRDSSEIRERLMEDVLLEDTRLEVPPATVSPVPEPVEVRTYLLPEETPEGHLTDLEAVADILDALLAPGRDLLDQLRQRAWEAPPSALRVPGGSFLSSLVDQVNEAAQARLGDVLLAEEHGALVVLEDYRDELEYLLALTAQDPRATAPASGPWTDLARRLTPLQLVVLQRLGHAPVPLRDLDALALQHGTMGSVVLEEMNAAALDTVGDLLTDPYLDPITLEEAHRFGVLRTLSAAGLTSPEAKA